MPIVLFRIIVLPKLDSTTSGVHHYAIPGLTIAIRNLDKDDLSIALLAIDLRHLVQRINNIRNINIHRMPSICKGIFVCWEAVAGQIANLDTIRLFIELFDRSLKNNFIVTLSPIYILRD